MYIYIILKKVYRLSERSRTGDKNQFEAEGYESRRNSQSPQKCGIRCAEVF